MEKFKVNLIEYGEKVKLDKKDKKILEALDQDARLSIADISRRVGIQRDSVFYRINRMKKLKVIRFFHTVLNPSLLGVSIYSYVSFSLHNITPHKEKELISYLKSNPQFVYIAKTIGKWDLIVNIAAKDLKHFDEVLSTIRTKFSEIIKDYETSSIIQEYKYDNMVELI